MEQNPGLFEALYFWLLKKGILIVKNIYSLDYSLLPSIVIILKEDILFGITWIASVYLSSYEIQWQS